MILQGDGWGATGWAAVEAPSVTAFRRVLPADIFDVGSARKQVPALVSLLLLQHRAGVLQGQGASRPSSVN